MGLLVLLALAQSPSGVMDVPLVDDAAQVQDTRSRARSYQDEDEDEEEDSVRNRNAEDDDDEEDAPRPRKRHRAKKTSGRYTAVGALFLALGVASGVIGVALLPLAFFGLFLYILPGLLIGLVALLFVVIGLGFAGVGFVALVS